MTNTIKKPLSWLEEFGTLLPRTLCHKSGKSTSLADGLEHFQELLKDIRSRGSRLWWAGNGGSSALCSHLSQDLINKLGIRSQTLSDAALITCMANDYGYPNVYSRPLEVLSEKGDLLIAVSSSGKSENILNASRLALNRGMTLVTLSAFSDDNPLWQLDASLSFYLPCSLYGLVEVGHEALLHASIETLWLEERG